MCRETQRKLRQAWNAVSGAWGYQSIDKCNKYEFICHACETSKIIILINIPFWYEIGYRIPILLPLLLSLLGLNSYVGCSLSIVSVVQMTGAWAASVMIGFDTFWSTTCMPLYDWTRNTSKGNIIECSRDFKKQRIRFWHIFSKKVVWVFELDSERRWDPTRRCTLFIYRSSYVFTRTCVLNSDLAIGYCIEYGILSKVMIYLYICNL